jgi:hypothetical protein
VVLGPSLPAPQDPAGDDEHDEDADDRPDDASPVEDVRVADAEPDREDQIAQERSRKADEEGHTPGLRPAQVTERIPRHEHPSDDSGEKADDDRSDMSNRRYNSSSRRQPQRHWAAAAEDGISELG